jgi:hypothetical protein
MRHAPDRDLANERVRRIGRAVEDPHLVRVLRRDEHAELRVETWIDRRLSGRRRRGRRDKAVTGGVFGRVDS